MGNVSRRSALGLVAISCLVWGCLGRPLSAPPPDPTPMDRETYTIGATDLLRVSDVLGELRLYGQVRNLMGRQRIVSRRPYGARPNAPRWVQVGLRVSLD